MESFKVYITSPKFQILLQLILQDIYVCGSEEAGVEHNPPRLLLVDFT